MAKKARATLAHRNAMAAEVCRSGMLNAWARNRSPEKVGERIAAIANKIIEKLVEEQNKP